MKDDGGSAFPCTDLSGYGIGPPDGGFGGMSLRDWFAGQALSGTLAFPIPGGEKTPENAARYAYEYADAMLAERKRNFENTQETCRCQYPTG